ncbi:hypothetical protein GCM10017612_24970 [Novosphingobium resinovorum]|nr:hypothetical protein GCM10017612_24970 [Novosphingobium resinovorum]
MEDTAPNRPSLNVAAIIGRNGTTTRGILLCPNVTNEASRTRPSSPNVRLRTRVPAVRVQCATSPRKNSSSGGAKTTKPSACPAYQSRQADQKPMSRTALVMTAARSAVTAGTMIPQTTMNAVTSATDWKRPNRGNTLRISHAAPTASMMQSSGRPTPVSPLNPNSWEAQMASGVQTNASGAQRLCGVTWSRANSTDPASQTTAMPPSKRVSTSASDAHAKYASAVPSTSPGYHLLRRYDS